MATTFMFIDDDTDDRELFCEALWDLDKSIKVINAVSGPDAFEKLGAARPEMPDIIFLDINMPIVSGWECLALLKENPDYKDIPVIMHSTSSNTHEKELAGTGGALGLATKPSDFETLKANLNEVLKYLRNGTMPSFFKFS